jgi:ABC-type Zn2+ transport system substrate-binding protein/surface adhesin
MLTFAADYENTQSQSFTVVATDAAGNASEQVVNVAINNLDEVAPSITSGDTGTAVNENSGADQVVYTATASDTDFNGLEDITFSLADDSLGFSIDADTGVVTTNADFAADYEDAQSQSFTVVATDAAGNASEQVVSVAINNLDEVAPSITSGDTGTAVNENSGADQVVYTATASDTDFNGAEDITFSLADESLGFSVDASTGVVTTNADFAADYENTQSQSFTVVATDAAGNASEQVVNVAINNLDEVAPSITSGDTGTAVNENSGADQVVYTATASDTDFNGAEDITFSLADESLGFSVDASTGVVTTNADFAADYENTQSQSFTVVATDVAGNASEQVVSVAINNLDEIAPSITSGDTATAVNENSGADQVVYTATASDTDFNGLEDITFSLADDSLGFSIDASTGVVTTNADFAADYEDAQSQSFTVVATDAAGNASEQVVSVAINNLDEVAPSITSGDTGTAVNENSGADQVVYTATASDTDFNGAEDITFSLADESLGFSVDASTGVVTTNADFAANYEDAQSQSFTVVATDAAGNASEQVVNVAINNLDEVAPSITSGDTGTAVNENSGEGQVVYTATATDDADTSDGLSFSLADESLGFSIDASTGVVTTNADFAADYEDALSQSFTVVATDVAGNASEQVVSVAINNLDEIAPSITSGDTATAVNENSGADQVVYTATASDTDFNGAEDITFSLADDSLGFSIDASTGVVTTNADFAADYEDAQSQSFTVVATDAAGNASEQVVSVAINNLDEIAPSITSGDTATAVNENSGADQVVYTATASDTDFNGLARHHL